MVRCWAVEWKGDAGVLVLRVFDRESQALAHRDGLRSLGHADAVMWEV